ncbi:hypothetical protein Ato02nite_089490 [Paractinoplanes toevensis]|uniref:Uncharacterized protein n=1 Tax=Paractinoplanes toevensis TaxID=571911 RepID=A0A920BQZ1_9ACTN|nr:hypothetical protein Ato02nite_089490 [Actinoplanes toevensis]
MTRPSSEGHQPEPLVSLRAAVILLLALVAGATAGVLTYWAGHPLAAAAVGGGGAAGGGLLLFNTVVGR